MWILQINIQLSTISYLRTLCFWDNFSWNVIKWCHLMISVNFSNLCCLLGKYVAIYSYSSKTDKVYSCSTPAILFYFYIEWLISSSISLVQFEKLRLQLFIDSWNLNWKRGKFVEFWRQKCLLTLMQISYVIFFCKRMTFSVCLLTEIFVVNCYHYINYFLWWVSTW